MELKNLLQRIKDNKEKLKNKVDFKDDTVGEFISDFSLVMGVDKVPNNVILYLYNEVYKSKYPKKKYTGFYRELSKHFKRSRTGTQRYYLLNKELLNVTDEQWEKGLEYVQVKEK